MERSIFAPVIDCGRRSGLMVSGSSPELAVRVRALAGDSVLCSWARHVTLSASLRSTQEYKWVPANCWGDLTNWGGMTCDGLASRPGGVEILLAASHYRSSGSYDGSSRIQALYQSISASHIRPDCPFHHPVYKRPGITIVSHLKEIHQIKA